MKSQKYDLIIIGAGISGLTTAYYIKKWSPSTSVLVIEKAPTFGQGNTSKAEAAFRDLFSDDTHFKMNHSSINFYTHLQEELKIDLGLKKIGYLFAVERNNDSLLNRFAELSKKTSLEILSKSQLDSLGYLKTVPDSEERKLLNLEVIEHGVLGKNCGVLDQEKLCNYYFSEGVKMGIEYQFGTQVKNLKMEPENKIGYPGEPFIWQKKKITCAETNRGDFYAKDFFLATDVWTGTLLDPLGIDSYTRPRKRQVFELSGKELSDVIKKKGFNEFGTIPLTVLPHSVYFRPSPSFNSIWVSVGDEYMRNFDLEDNPLPEQEFFTSNIYPVVSSYLPQAKNSTIKSSWAGYISLSTIDRMPFIYRNLNVYVIIGTSGAGITKGDADGRVAASLYIGKETAELYGGAKVDVGAFGNYSRKMGREEIGLSELHL